MLNKFSEYIDRNIAPSPYQEDTFGETSTGTCPLCRLYNNIWGPVSGTCMANKGDKYVITGSIMRQPELWEKFLVAENWGVYVFKQAVGIATLSDLLARNGLEGSFGNQNGDPVYIVRPKMVEPSTEPKD